jgi:hypothetical protein
MDTLIGTIVVSLLLVTGCSTGNGPATHPEAARQHADRAFSTLKAQDQPQQAGDSTGTPVADASAERSPSAQNGLQVPLGEVAPTDGDMIRATGYGPLAKGITLCQHSADLAARVELSKLAGVKVTEKSVDRIRERTGKDADQDIEVVREGQVNVVLSEARIIDRKIDKEAGTCSSTAVISKQNLFRAAGNQIPQVQPTAK